MENISPQFLFTIAGIVSVSFIASVAKVWENIQTHTGLRFTQWLRLTTLGYVEREGGWILFSCPDHGLQRDIKHGYTDMFGPHTLIFADGTFCDCPDCIKEAFQ